MINKQQETAILLTNFHPTKAAQDKILKNLSEILILLKDKTSESINQDKLNDWQKSYLKDLNEEQGIENIQSIYDCLSGISNGKITVAKIRTTIELDKEQENTLVSALNAKYKSTKVLFETIIDHTLITGISITVGDTVFELSFKQQIEALSKQLMQ